MPKTTAQLELEGNAWKFTPLGMITDKTPQGEMIIEFFRITRDAIQEKNEPAKIRLVIIVSDKIGEMIFTRTDVNNINNKKIFDYDGFHP